MSDFRHRDARRMPHRQRRDDRRKETFKIGKAPDGFIRSFADSEEGVALDGESPVSMNFWGFTPWALRRMETYYSVPSLRGGQKLKSECLLPTMVGDMLPRRVDAR